MAPKQKPDASPADLIKDLDDASLRIFSMYQNKTYLPNRERVSNIAWRIQAQKMLKRPSGVSKPPRKQPVLQTQYMAAAPPPAQPPSRQSADSHNTSTDDFDYVAHIRRISQEEYGAEPPSRREPPRRDPSRLDSSPNLPTPNSDFTAPPTGYSSSAMGVSSSVPNVNPSMLLSQATSRNTYMHPSQSESGPADNSFLNSYINSLETTLKNDYKLSTSPAPQFSPSTSFSNYSSDKMSTGTSKAALECSNCHTRKTPLWRKTSQGLTLCNACGLFYKLHGSLRPSSNNLFKPYNQGQSTSPGATSKPPRKSLDNAISSSNTGLFAQINGAPPPQDATFTEKSGGFSFVDFDRQNQDAQEMQNSAANGADEIDKLLNMNLFQSDSFVIGADKHTDPNVNAYDLNRMEATDEILIEEPKTASNWNWLDFEPTTTGGR